VRGAAAPAAVDDSAVDAVGADLLARWAEPHRHYHGVAHLAAVLSVVDAKARQADDADLVRLAAWGHDAVYDPRAPGNEARSAEVTAALLDGLGLPTPAVTEVCRLILLTTGHDTQPGDRNGALLCDADLAVLAGPPEEYDRYAAAVRREYAHVPDDLFRAGRAAVLSHLLALPALYRLPEPHARWEGPARANLRRELGGLTG
jgi:predicted metal-dependent HD superfamily phosphohydrolase